MQLYFKILQKLVAASLLFKKPSAKHHYQKI